VGQAAVARCLVAAAAAIAHAPAAEAGGYRCYVGDFLSAGIVANTVKADGSVDCAGFGGPGSVRFSVRLMKYDSDAKRWRTLKVRARTYRTLRKQHLLSVSRTPCEPGTYRGVFRAMLRNSAGGLVSTNVQKLGNLHVLPGCVVK
jgi:hypothetical protein